MAHSVPIVARPRALWHGRTSAWRERFDGQLVDDIRSVLKKPASPVGRRSLGVLRYRPDLFRRLGPAALQHPTVRNALLAEPACGLELLTSFYEETAGKLETSVAGDGESVYGLLHWAAEHGKGLRQPERFYRQTLIADGYWGLKYAMETGNASLLGDIHAWCGDERRNYAAAAALFLVQHPREPVAPLSEVVLSNPFYAYLVLPHLSPRGLSVTIQDIGDEPKWAWHFARSAFVKDRDALVPRAARDPGWAIEWASLQGWLSHSEGRRKTAALIDSSEPNHPLREPAVLFLEALGQPDPAKSPCAHPLSARPPLREPHAPIPQVLSSGQSAEARALRALRVAKNTEVWRPSLQQVASPDFRAIVGQPLYTVRGIARGTIVDGIGDSLAEIKSGRSILNSTYQLRLQTYRSVIEERPLKIYTNRPVDVAFGQWLDPWGVKIEPLPAPEP